MKTDYGTLSQTINGLKAEGYTLDFNVQKDCLICHNTNTQLSPEEFEIDGVFRFEGESDPDDEAVLYAISSTKSDAKGVLVNGYGVSNDDASAALVQKLNRHR
ncbi:phosphoribosylpyrophosphate synthetase [Mucilaginibacter sp. 14171R-50]|uniref:phosphoribosylpyrophosphate synthetase n=1 Tax=Mucilaginibacter sp. 14171R-50 TaxID=2703789 RepID=UPI00138D2CD4|nr:phosphoribosylpyrophosphate synthetase [Mucilaginibacter sp. 14171R-50]QHS56630.1 phosphoribosylpyrophosphate synthetase [Mucilaginibacter sp. 14171R-50]